MLSKCKFLDPLVSKDQHHEVAEDCHESTYQGWYRSLPIEVEFYRLREKVDPQQPIMYFLTLRTPFRPFFSS